MKTKSITYAALSLALVLVCFLLFRGVSNILNSILIPIILYISLTRCSWQEFSVLILAVVFSSLLFFIQQIFFFLLYSALAILLYKLMNSRRDFFIKAAVLSIGVLTGFIFSINCTDIFLGTAIKKTLLAITNGSSMGFFTLLALEAIIVAVSLLVTTIMIKKRIKK